MKQTISKSEIEMLNRDRLMVYRKCFDLSKDSLLLENGIDICAITEVRNGKVNDRIVFREKKTGEESSICQYKECSVVPNPESESGVELVLTKSLLEPIKMQPREHYAALKSVASYLAKNGILNTMKKALEKEVRTGKSAPEMNSLFRGELFDAIYRSIPGKKERDNFAFSLFSNVSTEGYKLASKDFKHTICNWFHDDDIRKLDSIDGGVNNLDVEVRRCISAKTDTPSIIRKLVNDEDLEVRWNISLSTILPEDVIWKLANDKDPRVRRGISMYTKNLPVDVIRKLARDEDLEVRRNLLFRENLPEDVMLSFVDPNTKLYKSFIEDQDTPESVINKIIDLNDEIDQVRIANLKWNLPESVIRKLADSKYKSVREMASMREELPIDVIKKMANDDYENVRISIANRVDLPEDLVRKLASDTSPNVRYVIASKEKLPNDVVQKLANDSSPLVRETIAKRKKLV